MANDEGKVWKDYVAGVKRLPRAKKSESLTTAKRVSNLHSLPIVEQVPAKQNAAAKTARSPRADIALSRRTERDLRAGNLLLDARLDLHGFTQAKAHQALGRFLVSQLAAGHRYLLIITGKGRKNSGNAVEDAGILRNKLREWLEVLPEAEFILKICPAAAKHGGTGAFYVILKRERRQK